MSQKTSAVKTPVKRRRPLRAVRSASRNVALRKGRSRSGEAMVRISATEYDRLLRAELALNAVRTVERDRDDPAKWADAGQFGLDLAGKTIARARKAAGLTQQDLGRKLGMPQSQISRIEKNPDRTTVKTLKAVAKALNVDIRAFISLVNE